MYSEPIKQQSQTGISKLHLNGAIKLNKDNENKVWNKKINNKIRK